MELPTPTTLRYFGYGLKRPTLTMTRTDLFPHFYHPNVYGTCRGIPYAETLIDRKIAGTRDRANPATTVVMSDSGGAGDAWNGVSRCRYRTRVAGAQHPTTDLDGSDARPGLVSGA